MGMLIDLRRLGIPVQQLIDSSAEVDFRDELFIAGPPLWWLKPGEDALTSWPTGGIHTRGIGEVILNPDTMVVFRPDVAAQLANNTIFNPDGSLARAGEIAFHEVLHLAIHDLRIAFATVEDEEVFCAQMERLIDLIAQAMKVLSEPGVPTDEQLDRLKQLIQQIKNLLDQLHADGTPGEQFLDLLGWDDQDNNGIPDILDEQLRKDRIDPNTMHRLPPNMTDVGIRPAE